MIRFLCSIALIAATTLGARAETITVFAAASLGDALTEAADLWADQTGNVARLNLAGSSTMARQIIQGAPADVFLSANVTWMDAVGDAGLIAPDTRRDLWANRLVLIAHGAGGDVPLTPEGLDGALGPDGRLAMGFVDAVPAGIYGRAALDHLGLWDGIATRVAQTDNVRAALTIVARGEAPLGVVYETDARAAPDTRIAAIFPTDSHPPITYPGAAIAGGNTELAAAFLDFLSGPQGQIIFETHGFTVLSAP